MLGKPGTDVLLALGLAEHKLGPGQCPVMPLLTADTARLAVIPAAGGQSFSSMVALKRAKILLTLGCCIYAQEKRWRSRQNFSVTGSGADVWERMEGLNCPYPFLVARGRGSMVLVIVGVTSHAGTNHDGSALAWEI